MRRFVVFGLALLLSACATTPSSRSSAQQARAWQAHQASVGGLQGWALFGRIAISTEDEAWSGKLRWRQAPASYQIQFEAPFGQGAMRLNGDAAGVVMQVVNGERYTAPDAESLLYRFFGMHLPLQGMKYWVTGLPEPSLPKLMEYDAAGRLARLEQAEWRIRYEAYRRVDGVDLPQKIELVNHALNLRLVIDRWGIEAG